MFEMHNIILCYLLLNNDILLIIVNIKYDNP